MLRSDQPFSSRRKRTSSTAVTLIGAGGFALVAAALLVLVTRPAETRPVAETAPQAPASAVPALVDAPAPVATTPENVTVAESPAPAAAAVPVDEQVEAQLAAGEFGAALTLAQSVDDVHERSALLADVARAQMAGNDFQAAQGTIQQIPVPARRAEVRGERITEQALAGGNSFADFQSLIQLIEDNTAGPWESVDGVGGTMTPFFTGVRVDPNGLMERATQADETGRLVALGRKARVAELNDDMAQSSALRLVSLTRLEREVAARLAAGQPVLETMQQLAGISQIQYVFVYPDAKEVVIGGPADGWRYDERGAAVSLGTGRPTLQLDDLVTVLRIFSPAGENKFGCSINPRQEGLRSLKEYVESSQSKGPLRSTAVGSWVRSLQKHLGLQDIEIYGVPKGSHVARAIVEADYKMKLIGIDRLDAGESIPSYFDLLPPHLQTAQSIDALRWWLTLNVDAIEHSADHNAFELQGSSVLCLSENQMLTADGQHLPTGQAEATNRQFAENFTQRYNDLAKRDPVFADVQNIFDLAVVAALCREYRLGERIGWNGGVFATGGAYEPAVYEAPTVIESVVNHRVYNGKDVVVQVAGGVRADVMAVVTDADVVRESPRLARDAERGRAPQLPEGRWWWDAAPQP